MYSMITFETVDNHIAQVVVPSTDVSGILENTREAISWAKSGQSFDVIEICGTASTLLVEPSTIRFVWVSNPFKDVPEEESPW